jgi:hypothetical protein
MPTLPNSGSLISKAHVAEVLDCSPRTVDRLREIDATFPVPVNFNHKVFFYRDEVTHWALSRPRVTEKPCHAQSEANLAKARVLRHAKRGGGDAEAA